MILPAVYLKRLLRVKNLLTDMTRNLLTLLVGHRNVEGEIVSREVFLGTGWNWTLKIFNLGMRLKSRVTVLR